MTGDDTVTTVPGDFFDQLLAELDEPPRPLPWLTRTLRTMDGG